MSRQVRIQTAFSAGELDPELAGRLDLTARREGARRLLNVLPRITGGLARRPGLRHLAEVPGARRLLPFPSPAGSLLAVLREGALDLYDAQGALLASFSTSLLTAARIDEVDFAVVDGALLLVHPEFEPRRLYRDPVAGWRFDRWPIALADPADPLSRPLVPFERFAPREVRVELQNPTPDPAAPGRTLVEPAASAPVFTAAHIGTWLRVAHAWVFLYDVVDATRARGWTREDPSGIGSTTDWAEQAFSHARGWPRTVTVHQNRLVVGGSRDLPDFVWFSRSGRFYDFSTEQGLDDEAVAFRLAAAEPETVLHLVPARRLYVFTTGGEWVVHGDPITPTGVEVGRQTTVGCFPQRRVRPVEVDGAVLFVGRSGRDLREFVFTDTEQAWQAADLALLAGHLLQRPRACAFDPLRRVLWVARADGGFASLTIDRNSNVVAWAGHASDGTVVDMATLDGTVHLLVERAGGVALERFEEELQLDGARTFTRPSPTTSWSGLDALVGRRLRVLADGRDLGEIELAAGTLLLSEPASVLVLGHAFAHEIVPFAPLELVEPQGANAAWRPVRLALRLHASGALRVDLGRGPAPVRLASVPFTGTVELRALGWRRGDDGPPWRIRQDDPVPFTLLSSTLQIEVNG